MKRFVLAPLAALLAWLGLAAMPASAQFTYPFRPPAYGPGYQPLLSPYLNMLRGGDAAANYYLGVVPEFQRRADRNTIYSSLQGLGYQIPAPPGIREEDLDRPLASTGHPTGFNNTGSYFGGQAAMRPGGNPFRRSQMPPLMGARGPAQMMMGGGGGGGGVWPNMMQRGGLGR